jgi:quinol monooxygenase YgiN
MWGLIAKMRIQPGQRDTVIGILIGVSGGMPGCLSYIVAKDPEDPDVIWATEVWESQASHDASFALPAVINAVTAAKPLVVGMESRLVTTPVGGFGISLTGPFIAPEK